MSTKPIAQRNAARDAAHYRCLISMWCLYAGQQVCRSVGKEIRVPAKSATYQHKCLVLASRITYSALREKH